MKLRELIQDLPGKAVIGRENPEISSITCDSRQVRPGSLYFAVRGEKDDGHRYLAQALERGATAVIAEKKVPVPGKAAWVIVENTKAVLPALAAFFYGHPSRKIQVAGVTGTNGKTTTTYFLESVLNAAGFKTGVLGTINYRIAERVLPSLNTTPGPLEIQERLAEMVSTGCQWAVMEVSSHGIDQGRVDEVSFDACLLTSIASHEHLDYHRSFRAYAECKARLFTRHLAKSGKENRLAVLNLDERLGRQLTRRLPGDVKAVTYGFHRKAMVRGLSVKTTEKGLRLALYLPGDGYREVSLRLPGRYNAYNALAAAAFGCGRGLPGDVVLQGLAGLETVPGRFEEVENDRGFRVIVDYAHTENGLENLLLTAREVLAAGGKKGRLLLAFGCGGDRDPSKRRKMGRLAARLADEIVLTSDNPRSEDPLAIIEQIKSGIPGAENACRIIPDRREAINFLVKKAAPGDMVVIAGKGHETYQVLGDTVVHFDDRQEARRALDQQ